MCTKEFKIQWCVKMSLLVYNNDGNLFNTFGFIDEVAEAVFETFAYAEEVKMRDECRTYVKALYPSRVANNSRMVTLSSSAVLRKIVRRRAPVFSPWADAREKAMLRDAQRLSLRMFRVRRV